MFLSLSGFFSLWQLEALRECLLLQLGRGVLCARRLLLVERLYVLCKAAGSGFFCARRPLRLGQSLLVLRLRFPAGAGGPPAPATVHSVPGVPGVPGLPGPMHCQVTFLSSGCRRRSASGGLDWRDVAQVAVPFACGLFSSVGRFYRSSSVRGSGPGVSSTRCWSLLHWRRLSVVLPAALVDCCLASLRAGVCSPPWRWRISTQVFMVAGFPLLRRRRSAPSLIPWPFLDLTLVLSRCQNAWN